MASRPPLRVPRFSHYRGDRPRRAHPRVGYDILCGIARVEAALAEPGVSPSRDERKRKKERKKERDRDRDMKEKTR
jgi:hypothetical protein